MKNSVRFCLLSLLALLTFPDNAQTITPSIFTSFGRRDGSLRPPNDTIGVLTLDSLFKTRLHAIPHTNLVLVDAHSGAGGVSGSNGVYVIDGTTGGRDPGQPEH